MQKAKEQYQCSFIIQGYLHQDPSSVLSKFDILFEIWEVKTPEADLSDFNN